MAYEKLNLTDGVVLRAEHLEHIEDGIVAAEEKAATAVVSVNSVANLIVTISDGYASHTPNDLEYHIANGGTAALYDGENYYILSYISLTTATFLSVKDDSYKFRLWMIYENGLYESFDFEPASASEIGDISTALDKLHAYAEALKGGDSE